MRILFVADSILKLKPKGDSTLAMVRAALPSHEVFWATENDIEYWDGKVYARAAQVSGCEKDALPSLGTRNTADVESFGAVLIRKDPPFDSHYVRLCWLLSLVEEKVWMLNKPSLLIRYHEKLVPLEAHSMGFLSADEIIPTHLGTLDSAKAYVREKKLDRVVVKPFLGFGGAGVELKSAKDFLNMPDAHHGGVSDWIVQPYFDEVSRTGDRRVFFLGGKILADVVRIPAKGGFISNFAQGGSPAKAEISQHDKNVLEKLGRFLQTAGIELAGADVIQGRISEVNITSPTGLRAIEQMEGKDFAPAIIEYATLRSSLLRNQ